MSKTEIVRRTLQEPAPSHALGGQAADEKLEPLFVRPRGGFGGWISARAITGVGTTPV